VQRVLAEAVWPAVWPAAVMGAYVVATRPLIGQSLVAVGAEMIAAVGVYAITFLTFGISAAERRFYLSKVLEFTTHARLAVPTVSESA